MTCLLSFLWTGVTLADFHTVGKVPVSMIFLKIMFSGRVLFSQKSSIIQPEMHEGWQCSRKWVGPEMNWDNPNSEKKIFNWVPSLLLSPSDHHCTGWALKSPVKIKICFVNYNFRVYIPKVFHKIQKFRPISFVSGISIQYCKEYFFLVQISILLLYIHQKIGHFYYNR